MDADQQPKRPTPDELARESVVKVVAGATGWSLRTIHPEHLEEGAVFLYLYDFETKRSWVGSVPKSSFHGAMSQLQAIGLGDSVNAIGHLVKACAGDELLFNSEQEKLLALMLSSYISKTATYARTNGATLASHFVCIHYAKTNMVRPFALAASDRYLIPGTALRESIEQVIAIDQVNHPEWMS